MNASTHSKSKSNMYVFPGKRKRLRTMTNNAGRLPCPKCDRTYKNRESLGRHIKFECGLAPTFQCPYCDHRSHQPNNLKIHISKCRQVKL